MDKYSIRDTRGKLKELLEELPFQITRYGKVIATVNRFNVDSGVQHTSVIKPISKVCPHGFPWGLCKKGCRL